MLSFLQSLLLLFHFCVFLSQLSELVWKLAEEISLQSASKCFQSFGPPANGNKSNAKKSRFCPNRNLTGTIYHWSVILRSFSVVLNPVKRDANGFFKVLLLSSHLLISRHPVRKSKFGASAVKGYCSFNLACAYNFLNYWQPTDSPARRSFVLCWIGKCDILYRVFQKFVPIFYSYKFH